MRLWIPVCLIAMIFMPTSTVRAYPIPVDCRNAFHKPTISSADIIQAFGHLGHVGVDYGVPVGTEVYAAMDGIVVTIYQDSRVYGRSIYLLHCDGYMSLYAHLSETKVKFGQIVMAGQLIGLSGGDPNDSIDGDGWSSGPHLHFEVRVPGHLDNNLYNIDPAIYEKMTEKYRLPPVWDYDRYGPSDVFMKG
jgi:murein DD-endopeptidase MepM/ murein hydrolase activator NlpD